MGLMLSRSIYPVLTVGAKHNNPKDFILFIGLEDYGERGFPLSNLLNLHHE
jgi:hypothetical protein